MDGGDCVIYVFDKLVSKKDLSVSEIFDSIGKTLRQPKAVVRVSCCGYKVYRVELANVEDVKQLVNNGSCVFIRDKHYALVADSILIKREKDWLLPYKVYRVMKARCERLHVSLEDLWNEYHIQRTRKLENGPWHLSSSQPNMQCFVEKMRLILLHDYYFPDENDPVEMYKNSSDDWFSNFDDQEQESAACASKKSTNVQKNKKEDEEECTICMQKLEGTKSSVKSLKNCRHRFHEDCINKWLERKPICPYCKTPNSQSGGQLDGFENAIFLQETMFDVVMKGFPDANGYIEITYVVPDGIQGPGHPNPGFPYTGTVRKAYLPNNQKGRNLATYLNIAFDRGFTFTVGTSQSTGISNTVVWSSLIPHKTRLHDGGPYGYPDDCYLDVLEICLKELGIGD